MTDCPGLTSEVHLGQSFLRSDSADTLLERAQDGFQLNTAGQIHNRQKPGMVACGPVSVLDKHVR